MLLTIAVTRRPRMMVSSGSCHVEIDVQERTATNNFRRIILLRPAVTDDAVSSSRRSRSRTLASSGNDSLNREKKNELASQGSVDNESGRSRHCRSAYHNVAKWGRSRERTGHDGATRIVSSSHSGNMSRSQDWLVKCPSRHE